MKEEYFDPNQLKSCTWQYTTCHHFILNFTKGELVFHKSDPSQLMRVKGFDLHFNKVICNIYGHDYAFIPEEILQYQYQGLQEARSKFTEKITISLN